MHTSHQYNAQFWPVCCSERTCNHIRLQPLAPHFLNNRIKRDLGFSGLVQGARGKAVSANWFSALGVTTSGLGRCLSGISPSLVLSEAKDMIDILLLCLTFGMGDGNSDPPITIGIWRKFVTSSIARSGRAWTSSCDLLGSFCLLDVLSWALGRNTKAWDVAGLPSVRFRDNSGALFERLWRRWEAPIVLVNNAADFLFRFLDELCRSRLDFSGNVGEDSDSRRDNFSKVLIASTLDALESFTSVR